MPSAGAADAAGGQGKAPLGCLCARARFFCPVGFLGVRSQGRALFPPLPTVVKISRRAPRSSLLAPHSLLLAPRATRLAPHSSPLAPRASLLAPRSSFLSPLSSRLAPSLLTPRSARLAPLSSLVVSALHVLATHFVGGSGSNWCREACGMARTQPLPPRSLCRYAASGHTASNAPDLFRTPKLSGAGPG